MPDYSFLSFAENDEIDHLAANLGPSINNSQSDPRTIPDVSTSVLDHLKTDDTQLDYGIMPGVSASVSDAQSSISQSDQNSTTDVSTCVSDEGKLDKNRSRRPSWTSEDEVVHHVLELSRKTAADEELSRHWYKEHHMSETPAQERNSFLPTLYEHHNKGGATISQRAYSSRSIDDHLLKRGATPVGYSGTRQPQQLDPGTAEGGGQYCDDCETYGLNRSYCNVCTSVTCDDCWERQIPHKPHKIKTPSDLPHEKTPWTLAQKTRGVFNPDISESQRREMHCKDMLTSWFGVHREDSARPLLRDYGRFDRLMASMKPPPGNIFSPLPPSARFPSFVSFVGETGAGKSSLIKLIIDLSAETPNIFDTPVVGAVGHTSPTSTDVHLYVDPCTASSDLPILYADCEGLEGGEREPVAAKAVKDREMQSEKHSHTKMNFSGYAPRHVSERDLIWADKSWKRTREYAVKELYPRLLYTFSDVIVFVLKNPKVIESVLVKLVDWAAAALEGSSNQPVLPHAIIVLNASENAISAELWDVDTATKMLMREMSQKVLQNEALKKHVQFWSERDRTISTVEDLILSYYTSIKVIRIPTIGRPNLIAQQINQLTGNIRSACQMSGKRKGDLRMLLNAEDMQPYLQYAFDHFSKSIETPFDFVQASFTHSPIPADFGGNILKLAIQLMDAWKDRAGARAIFEELAVIVASCIMLDATRHEILGTAEKIIPQYLEHLDNALENFCDRYWPCEYVRNGKGRCVNVRSGHTKGHQSRSGRVLAGGDYESQFTFIRFREHFRNEVYEHLDELIHNLPRNHAHKDSPEVKAAEEQHKTKVLKPFFAHAHTGNTGYEFSSHTACFCCLFDFPEHSLSCGHVLCTGCLKAYGYVTKENTVEFWECPIDGKKLEYTPFRLKPAHCGVRILTLDGGGVRGIAELEILKQIENALGNGILRIQDFLDYVVGTSTGGIIALGLAAMKWDVEECIQKFETLCYKAFQPRRMANQPLIGLLVRSYYHSLYETKAIEDALKEAFLESTDLFGGRITDSGMPPIKVAVTTAAVSSSVVLSNYNRIPATSLPYHFERPEKAFAELRVWEAARATSAAPLYFTPFSHPDSKQTYYDGGVYHNNPIDIAERERRLIWPDLEEPDVVISIGTGHNLNSHAEKGPVPYKPMATRGIISQGLFLANMAKDHIAVSLDSEQTWKNFYANKRHGSDDKFRYIRLNTAFSTDPPQLDDLSKIQELRKTARKQFEGQYETRMLALKLVATSFYFQPDYPNPLKRKEVTGYIRCRLPDKDPRISALGEFIYEKTGVSRQASFSISEKSQPGPHTTIKLGQDILERMIRDREFRLPQIKIPLSSETTKTSITLRYGVGESFPISGFPRCLIPAARRSKPPRRALTSTETTRWAARTQSQRHHQWTPRKRTANHQPGELLSRFNHSSHVLGNTTSRELELEQQRLTKGAEGYVPQESALEYDDRMDPWWSPSNILQLQRQEAHEVDGIGVLPEHAG